MALVTIRAAELAFGLHPLLDRANFAIDDDERIGLIGRNGTGKSSLLRRSPGSWRSTTASHRAQRRRSRRRSSSRSLRCRPRRRCARASSQRGRPRGPYRRRARALARRGAARRIPASLRPRRGRRIAGTLGRRAQARGAGARTGARARSAAARRADQSSRHRRHRAARRARVQTARAAIVITHDRVFLDRVATRIVELDRGLLRSYPGQLRRVRSAQGRRARRRSDGERASSTSSGHRRRRGSARASKRGARATKGACAGSKRCAASARCGASASAASSSRSMPASAPASSSPSSRRRPSASASATSCATRPADHARRPARRCIGPQRRRQVDAAEADPRPARARQRHRAARHASCDVAYFDQLRERSTRAHARRDDQPGLRLDRDGGRAQARADAISAISCFRRSARMRR